MSYTSKWLKLDVFMQSHSITDTTVNAIILKITIVK